MHTVQVQVTLPMYSPSPSVIHKLLAGAGTLERDRESAGATCAAPFSTLKDASNPQDPTTELSFHCGEIKDNAECLTHRLFSHSRPCRII